MRGSGAALLLVFASACVAQIGNPHAAPAAALALSQGDCPIGIEARQRPHNAYLLTEGAPVVHPSYQIIFTQRGERAIQEVVLALVGPSGPHLRNAGAPSQIAEHRETFTLTASGKATLTPKKLTGVEWINLVSVMYADGTRWQSSRSNVCRVAPDGFVLVQ